jgi:copper(I)-binding protein
MISVREKIESPAIRSLEFSSMKFYLEVFMMRPIDSVTLPAYRVMIEYLHQKFS